MTVFCRIAQENRILNIFVTKMALQHYLLVFFLHILKRKIFFLEPGLRTERARENITMKVKYSLVKINDRQVDQLTLILRFKTKEGVIFFSK